MSPQVICLLLLPIIALGSDVGQGLSQHVIKGTVFLPGNRPAARAEVVLENSSGLQLSRAFADQDGRYAFPGLRFGAYRVVAHILGSDYEPSSQHVEISGSQDSLIIRTVDLHLRQKPKPSSPGFPGTVPAFSQEVPPDVEKEYRRGAKLLDEGSKEKGVEHLRRAIEMFPDYFQALVRLGTEHASDANYERAVPLLARACKVNPSSVTSHVTLGMSLVELGEFEHAVAPLTRGKSLNSQSVSAHLYLGIAQLQLGQTDEAELNLKRAYRLGGAERAAIAHLYLASIFDKQGKYSQAADELESYLREVPKAKNAAKIREAIARLRNRQDKR